ncbi:hypothetical protein DSO57_1031679, partial [Entomophthora muscae]
MAGCLKHANRDKGRAWNARNTQTGQSLTWFTSEAPGLLKAPARDVAQLNRPK